VVPLTCGFYRCCRSGVNACRPVYAAGGWRLTAARPEVQQVLETTRLLQVVRYFPTPEEALASFDRPA